MSAPHNRLSVSAANLNLRFRISILAFLTATVCYLAARLGGALIINIPQTVWPLWPGCAVLVAILLLVPRKIWPILLPTGLAGFVLYDLQASVSIPRIVWLILADTLEVLVAAWGLSYSLNGLPRLNSLKALAKYSFFTVFLAPLVVSSIGIHDLRGDSWLSWRVSFLSEALAFLTVTPAILGLLGQGQPSLRTFRAHYLEAAILVSALTSVSYFMFVAPGRGAPPALLYSLVPFLIWSALRFGSTGVGASASIVALMSIWGAVHGRGPFTETDPINRVLFLQLFLLFTSVPFMVLAVVVEDRKCAQDELHTSEERLRLAMDSGKAVGWEWELKTGRDYWFGDLKMMFGIPSESFAGRLEDFYRYVHPEDRQQVSQAVADAEKSRSPYAAEFRVVWPDGTVRWVAASGKFYYLPSGEPERMSGMAVDITARKQLEVELRESQDRMGAIVASAMDAVIAIDDAQRIVLFNSSAEKMFGCRAPNVLGSSIERFIPQRFRAAHSSHIHQFGETGISSRNMGTLGTLWALRADGDEFPIEASISHASAAGKKFFTVIIRDVSERKRAEEALRESEARFRLVSNTAPVLIWMSNTDKLCTYFNTPWLDFTGRSIESELGNGWAEGVHPEDFKGCLETYTKAFDRRERFSMEYRLRRHDGEYRWVLDIGVPRFNEDGSFAGFIGSGVDVTNRRAAEEALREKEDKLRLLLDSTAEAIYGIDLEGRCTFCNSACLRALGYQRVEDLLGKNMHNLIHRSRADRTRLPAETGRIMRALQTGQGVHVDDEVLWDAKERSFPAEYWSFPQRKGQEVVGAVVTFLDITERKRTEVVLENMSRRLIGVQEQERSRIAGELHDDIGQRLALLTVELGQLPQHSPDLPAEVGSRIDELREQASEIAADVQSLSHELHSSKLEYLGIATAMRGFCREFSAQQNVEIVFAHNDIPRTIPSDISLCLFRVLQEALHNAVKHSGVRHFDAELRASSDAIDLTVRDSGSSFDVEEAMKTSGLGLVSMTERIKLVGGQLSIESHSGRGTTIHARVPLREAARAAP